METELETVENRLSSLSMIGASIREGFTPGEAHPEMETELETVENRLSSLSMMGASIREGFTTGGDPS
ncbi:hypothetical protein DPMN_147201 [Dreissena polymorpha]|uniref:Uncharacterized protein n=1 Tax=Dreissena polymorpha TaxID=45954 RepID=A0A9D4J2S3_DREPO|nr:hypothetical protein DPMN_147201 [Dreissena polymorpha]